MAEAALYKLRGADEYVVEDGERFEMGGNTIVPVRAAHAIEGDERFINSRHQATRFGWVQAQDLTPIDIDGNLPALIAWKQAMDAALFLELDGPTAETFAAMGYEIEAGNLFHMHMISQQGE